MVSRHISNLDPLCSITSSCQLSRLWCCYLRGSNQFITVLNQTYVLGGVGNFIKGLRDLEAQTPEELNIVIESLYRKN